MPSRSTTSRSTTDASEDAPKDAGESVTIPPAVVPWIENAAKKVIGAFVLAFAGVCISAGAGAVNLSTLHAALDAAIIAGLTALDALAGDIVSPGSVSVVSALKARLNP
jgi:hypothetical protein